MDYDVMIKKFGGWSSVDTIDEPLTKKEYLDLLDPVGDKALAKEINEADDFKVIESGRYDLLD